MLAPHQEHKLHPNLKEPSQYTELGLQGTYNPRDIVSKGDYVDTYEDLDPDLLKYFSEKFLEGGSGKNARNNFPQYELYRQSM